jgi:hypothetical protein
VRLSSVRHISRAWYVYALFDDFCRVVGSLLEFTLNDQDRTRHVETFRLATVRANVWEPAIKDSGSSTRVANAFAVPE